MQIKSLVVVLSACMVLAACSSSCDQQEYAEKFGRLTAKMFEVEKSGQLEAKGPEFQEFINKMGELKNIRGDDLGEACAIMDDLLDELD